MNNSSKESQDYINENESDSDDNLKIVINSPKKRSPIKPTRYERRIIESIEDELERRLEEKAAKTNLNATHVKNIIKHVVTNEHVLALVRKVENPSSCNGSQPLFEPKLTRSKAKELLSSSPDIISPIVSLTPVAWSTPIKTSETQVLLSEELQEDSSGDEYIPHEDESEDDRDSSIFSDPPSVPPPTPPTPTSSEQMTQTSWSEDGVFKIPHPKLTRPEPEDEATIARRTRSKLSLSATPLEVIEEAFIPPDITTDMYDMDCDNDDWKDFLKKFTRPLDEVAKPSEDEDHDPEYNILADEETEVLDREELRMDKAVKITKKELNNLIAELFEFATTWTTNSEENNTNLQDNTTNVTLIPKENSIIQQNCDSLKMDDEESHISINSIENEEIEIIDVVKDEEVDEEVDEEENNETFLFSVNYFLLLQQQMRQHVQLLTQNFILTYKHPELHKCAVDMKEYLLNLKFLREGKPASTFDTINLNKALQLIEDWEQLLDTNTDEVNAMMRHIENTMALSIQRKQSGTTFIVTFPKLILQTISNSDVFIYPGMLPKIPFKSPRLFSTKIVHYTYSESHLIALGLEQFVPFTKEEKNSFNRPQGKPLKRACAYISQYILPIKTAGNLYNHTINSKHNRCGNNPIKHYFLNNEAPSSVHYVIPLDVYGILPPSKRSPDDLPYQWKTFLYPESCKPQALQLNCNTTLPTVTANDSENQCLIQESLNQSSLELLPPIINSPALLTVYPIPPHFIPIKPKGPVKIPIYKRKSRKVRNLNKRKNDPLSKFIRCLSKPSRISKLLGLYAGDINEKSDQLYDKLLNCTKDKDNTKKISPLTESTLNVTTKSYSDLSSPTHLIMLPSMPSLNTPIKVTIPESGSGLERTMETKILNFSLLNDVNFQGGNESTEVEFCKQTENNKGESNVKVILCSPILQQVQSSNNEHSKAAEGNKDNIEDINALLAASSRVKPAVRKEPSGAEKKKAKIRREFLANLVVSAPEDPTEEKKKSEMFALQYYDKMRETLELEYYQKIMQILNDYEEDDAVELYKIVEKVLRPKYEDLADEFLLFLREREAAAVNKLIPWMRMNNRSKFLRKLELYFKDQPTQLKKIYKCLTELSQTVDISMDKIKTTLLPMFKGNQVLSDLFLQNFLDERPPPSLLDGPYETINVRDLSKSDDEEVYETIIVPDTEDKYGGSSCICSCHEIEDPEFKTRYRHCIRCGTKFVNGRAYIQTGRGLRPATISFLTNPNIDHNIRLGGLAADVSAHRKKRADFSPSKQVTLSPTKETVEEDSDDDVDGKKKTKKKSPRRRKIQTPKNVKDSVETQKTPSKKSNRATSPSKKELKPTYRKRSNSVKKPKDKKIEKVDSANTDDCEKGDFEEEESEKLKTKPGSSKGQFKRLAEDSIDWEEVEATPVSEETPDIKPNSPEQQTAESESEFCEESSQDNCESDSNSSVSSYNIQSQSDSNAGDEGTWKREEDKVILETFQRENDKETSFRLIADQLRNRSVPQIRNRFETLMKILMRTIGHD